MGEINIFNLIITFMSSILGTVLGGIVTLLVNKKFEVARLRLNNINEMNGAITPRLQDYIAILNAIYEFLETNEFRNQTYEQKDLELAIKSAVTRLNEVVNIYEIELSEMLDFYDNLLIKSNQFIERFSEIDIIGDEKKLFLGTDTKGNTINGHGEYILGRG